jgi:hypothetical protein
MRQIKVTCTDDGITLDAYTKGETWNGWEVPYFIDEQLPALFRYLTSNNVKVERIGDDIHTTQQDDEFGAEIWHPVNISIDSRTVPAWPVGGMSWCWEV